MRTSCRPVILHGSYFKPLYLLSLSAAVLRSYFGWSEREVFLDNVLCTGSEDSILDCTALQGDSIECYGSNEAGVVCGG